MDKEIALEVITQKRRKTTLIGFAIIAVVILAIWGLRLFIKPTVNRSEIATAVVEKGNIENTINATGEVLPEFEEIVTSPINASVKNTLLDAGNPVNAGQSIITLDKSATQTQYDKLNFQLESKRAEISKLRLDLGKSFYDVQSNNAIKQLRIGNLTDAVENAKRLYKAGGATREDIEQAELNLKVAQLEKKQLENEITNKQQTMRIEIREAEIAAAIQQNDLNELKRKLMLANIVASRKGIITYVNKNIGANVHEGETLARIADLSGFKVQGSVSDNSVDDLHSGIPVIIRINDKQLRGHVSNVSPSIQNSIVSFDIQLDERSSKLLRPNMKVDVFLITATHSRIMRVANGPAFKGSNLQDIFVLNGNKAERRAVHIGLSNFDYVELKDGVKPGDVVITSDMAEYKNSKEVIIAN